MAFHLGYHIYLYHMETGPVERNDGASSSEGKEKPEIIIKKIMKKKYNRNEVADMATYEKCIIIIDEKVYDVSEFLERHPGGDDIIMEYLGRDATSAFEGKGHSEHAFKLLESFQIGIICDDD